MVAELRPAEQERQRPRVALIMRGLGYSYQDTILSGVHEACGERGYDVVCLIGGVLAAPDPRSSVYSVVGPQDIDGVIFATGSMGGTETSPAFQQLFARFSSIPSCSIAYAQPGMASVCIDNASGVYAATRHLIEIHGRRRLAFLNGLGIEAQQRFEGFERAHRDCGLEFDRSRFLQGNYGAETGVAAVEHLGTPSQPLADALVAANDWMAMGALEEAERRGFSLPDGLSIVGFDDSDQARFTTPPLTTVRQPIADLGREAVAIIAAQLAGQPVAPVKHVNTELILRHSCGCRNRAVLPADVRSEVIDSIAACISQHRSACRAALLNGAGTAGSLLGSSWTDELLDALLTDLAHHSGAFSGTLGKVLRSTSHLGSVSSWHGAMSALRGAAIQAGVTDLRQWFGFESIIEEAHVLIGSHAEQVQGRRRIAKEVQTHALEAIGNAVRTALDYSSLGRKLGQRLSTVGLTHCWVTRLKYTAESDAPMRLVATADSSGERFVELEPEYPAGRILPSHHWLAEPNTYVVLPMEFGGETLGLTIFRHSSPDAAVYQQVCAPITAAVKSTLLLESVVAEATRREAAERERLAHEMAIAQRIQTAMFPKQYRVAGLEMSASMDPASEVGGDYFDVLPADDGCWLGIGDVVGHGLPTGLISLMIQSIVAGMAQHGGRTSAAELWRDMNAVLCDNVRIRLGQSEHATLSLIRYWTGGRLQCAGAHETIVLLRQGGPSCEVHNTPGIWAGVTDHLPSSAMTQLEFQLQPGDLMLLYTDGLTEARNDKKQMFGLSRLCAALERHRDAEVEEIRRQIIDEVTLWGPRQDDDRTLVVARYRGMALPVE